MRYSSFPIFPNLLPNPGRILQALTFNGCDPLYVNAGKILPGGFDGKLRNIGKVNEMKQYGDEGGRRSEDVSSQMCREPSLRVLGVKNQSCTECPETHFGVRTFEIR